MAAAAFADEDDLAARARRLSVAPVAPHVGPAGGGGSSRARVAVDYSLTHSPASPLRAHYERAGGSQCVLGSSSWPSIVLAPIPVASLACPSTLALHSHTLSPGSHTRVGDRLHCGHVRVTCYHTLSPGAPHAARRRPPSTRSRTPRRGRPSARGPPRRCRGQRGAGRAVWRLQLEVRGVVSTDSAVRLCVSCAATSRRFLALNLHTIRESERESRSLKLNPKWGQER